MIITPVPAALVNFVPLDAELAKNIYASSRNPKEKADMAGKLYRFYLHQGDAGYTIALPWFVKAFENQSPEAYVAAYNATNEATEGKTCIDPLIKQELMKKNHRIDKVSRSRRLAHAVREKHPIACQIASQAIIHAGTEKEDSTLLAILQENRLDISRDQSLELQAIALIKGDRIITNNYGQLLCAENSSAPNDQERIAMMKTLGLEIGRPLGRDLRVISALGKGRQASSICFNGLIYNTQETIDAFERVNIPIDNHIKCTLGNTLRGNPERYGEVLKHFTSEELFHTRYNAEQTRHLHGHAVELFQSRINPALCKDLLAPGVFHHKIA